MAGMTYDATPSPDWVVLGLPTGDGRVAVYASKELNQAELASEVDHDEIRLDRLWMSDRSYPPVKRHTLSVEMRTYVIVVADTYPDALRRLFETWTPEPDQPAISGRAAIEGRPT
jgi:hypothetical protein